MQQNLVIVESPAKARTIKKFLGDDFIVKSTVGHIRDLPRKDLGVDVQKGFVPIYKVSSDKKEIVKELKELSRKATTVWLATDEDREGEAIAWHLVETLGLSRKKTKRIVYHEITKTAIQEAFAAPRSINENLVNAQQARRILDRLVGYELSPILWKKVKPALSAGRVQSVAVRLLVEREREINEFQPTSFFKVTGIFIAENENSRNIKSELQERLSTEEDARQLLSALAGADFFVKSVEKKPANRTPSPPFTTSTLQQEANRKLGYPVLQTMRLAQRLYEEGKITYMRTDSVTLSDFALNAAKNEIQKLFGERYWKKRQYTTKSASAQEAHEAIRPTFLSNRTADTDDRSANKLYELIWKRTIASQMADAEIEKTIVTIEAKKNSETIVLPLRILLKNVLPSLEKQNVAAEFIASGEVILFDGFLKVYFETSDEDIDRYAEEMLPPLSAGQKLIMEKTVATEKFTAPPPRYHEASLVKKMESLGIGRPSTYAPIISTIQKRAYVVKESRDGKERQYRVLSLNRKEITAETKMEITGAEKNKLFPTDIGIVVNDFLHKNFPDIMDYHFTARVEEEFDEIASGKLEWHEMLKEFYFPFHKRVEQTTEESERVSGERILGIDPKSGRQVLVRIGRFGPMVQIGKQDKKKKPLYASLRSDQRLETITLEEALLQFKLPRTLGKWQGEEVLVSIGRYGPYIRHKGEYTPLAKTDDVYSIELDRAIEILKMPKLPRTLGNYLEKEVTVNRGRFGSYIKWEDIFVSLKKTDDPFTIKLERAVELIKEKKAKQQGKEKLNAGGKSPSVKPEKNSPIKIQPPESGKAKAKQKREKSLPEKNKKSGKKK